MSARYGTAAELAAALDGEREGRDWRCRCPSCGGGNLTVGTSNVAPVLVHCFNGCSWRDVFDALREMQLSIDVALDGAEQSQPDVEADRLQRRIYRASALYLSGGEAGGTIVEIYLQSRGITMPVPPALRFVPLCPHRNGQRYPAMVAAVVDARENQVGVHLTFLKPDGSGKADFPKKSFQRECRGRISGTAVRLGSAHVDQWLCIGEGIESTASAMQLLDACGGIAALSASGLRNLVLPPEMRMIRIAVDNDRNGVGQDAACDAAWRWQREGRTVRVVLPPVGQDFNDVLRGAA